MSEKSSGAITPKGKTAASKKPKKPMRKILDSPLKGKLTEDEIQTVIRAVHIVPWGKGWEVLPPSRDDSRRRFRTQEAAFEFAQSVKFDRHSKVFLHLRNGRVQAVGAN